MGQLEELRDRGRRWAEHDPDPETRDALNDLVDQADEETLTAHLGGALEFGTAGLRAPVGPGPLRMNRAVIIRTTRGLAEHLLAEDPDAQQDPVVVGFDARPDSHRFALDVLGVLTAAGIPVRWFPEPSPTPLVAFSARVLDASAAVVVTASHNPPEYNGYKVYRRHGVQIIPPEDRQIAEAIGRVGPADEVPRVEDPDRHDLVEVAGPDLIHDYQAALTRERPEVDADRSLRIVYTPLHGVGGVLALQALEQAGYSDLFPVPEQLWPDGSFPTVPFPNPEEPGALDLALDLATKEDADLVLANDPDADRLAVAIPTDDGWTRLTGNQIGLLLADHLLNHGRAADPLVVSSIVSSPGLGAIADEYGARWETTLTGFKWICNAALALRDQGYQLVLGYEEALGYTVGQAVNDKDGIGAAVAFADLVATLRADDRDVTDALDDLARRHGLWVSVQHAVERPGPSGAEDIEQAMRRAGQIEPDRIGTRALEAMRDFRTGVDDRPAWLPATPLVAFELDGGRALVRPSGTEPKLKIYVDLHALPGDDLRSDGESGRPRAGEDALRDEALAVGRDLAALLGLGS